MREKNIENKIKRYLTDIGAYYFKHHGGKYSRSGVPDIIVCYKGRFIGIEVKNEIGKLSILQERNLIRIADNGGIALAVRTLDEVKEVFETDNFIAISKGILKLC